MKLTKRRFEEAMALMLLSSSFISILNLSVKIGLGEMSMIKVTFLRYFMPLVFVLPFLLRKTVRNEILETSNLKLHFLRSLSAVTTQLSLSYYLTRASLLDATMLWCTSPLFVPFIARFVYKQKIEQVTWWNIALGFVGVLLILKPSGGIFDWFSVFGLIAGISTAFGQLLWGVNIERGKVSENLFYLYLLSALIMAIVYLVFETKSLAIPIDRVTVLVMVGLGLASIGNQFFRSLSYKRAKPYLLTPFLYFSVVLSGALDWMIFKKPADLWAVLGFGLVLLGTFIKWRWIVHRLAPK